MEPLRLEDILDEKFYIKPEDTLINAIKVMNKYGKGVVVVVEDDKPVGIITERDIVRFFYERVDLSGRAIDYATKPVISINKSRTLLHTLIIMVENNIRRVAVVDDRKEFVGVVTERDILVNLSRNFLSSSLRVKHVIGLGRPLISASPERPLSYAIELMSKNNIGAVPIVENGKAVGIITERDILRLSSNFIDIDKPVREYMTSPVLSVNENTEIVEVVKIMDERRVRRLVVEDDDGNAVGIITQRDIIQSFEGSYRNFLEKRLKITREMLNLLPEIIVDVIDTTDGHIIIWANRSAMKHFGVGIIDSPITEIIPEDEWVRIYMSLIKDGKFESIRFSSNGSIYDVSGSLLKTGSEERGRIKLIIRDVTQEHKKEEEVRKGFETYTKILNSTPDMILIYDVKDGKICLANYSAIKTLGYTEDEIVNLTIYDIVDADKETIMENVQRIIRQDSIVKGTRYYKTIDGRKIPVEITATKVDINSRLCILVAARDISEKIEMEEEIKKKKEELEIFHNFIISLNRSTSEEEAYQVLLHVLKQLNFDGVHIYRVDSTINKIMDTFIAQEERLWLRDCLELDIDMCKAMVSSNYFVVNSERDFKCPYAHISPDVKSYMCITISVSGNILAIVTLMSKEENFFTQEKITFLQDLFSAFGPFVSNLRLIKINRELSIRDPLTGLYNRRFIDEVFEREIQRSKRNKKDLSVVMVDIDKFKKLNDTYGHKAGDMILKTFASKMVENLRSSDVVGRYGGEEFIIIMPDTEKSKAVEVAERLRKILSSTEFTLPEGKNITVTASFGVATFPEDGSNIDRIVHIADERLYRAKKEGRNKVVSA